MSTTPNLLCKFFSDGVDEEILSNYTAMMAAIAEIEDHEVMELVTEYMETGNISQEIWNEQTVWKPLHAANRFGLLTLKNQCEDFLVKRLSLKNLNFFYTLSNHYSLDRVREKVLELMHTLALDLFSTPEKFHAVVTTEAGSRFLDIVPTIHLELFGNKIAEADFSENSGEENFEGE